MGCDGGTIPKRDELVRKKKEPEKKDKEAELAYRWGYCSITQEPLQKPIVACQLGRLYSKVSVIEVLLDKSSMPESSSHIKNIRDVKEVNFTPNPAYVPKAKTSEAYDDSLVAEYICPVTGLEMNGKFRFVLYWSCGCVVSERAYKEVKDDNCHKCQKPVSQEDVIVLNGNDEDIAAAKKKMAARKAKAKADKKVSKSSNPELKVKCKESNGVAKSSSSGSKRSASSVELIDPQFKKTKNDYSVAKDPKASDVYKSLFTTHESAAKQERAHWITYNPFYN